MFPFTISGTVTGKSDRLNHSLGSAIRGLKKYRASWRSSEKATLVFSSSLLKWSFNPLNGVSSAQLVYFKNSNQKVTVRYKANLIGALVNGILLGLWIGLDIHTGSVNLFLAGGVTSLVYLACFLPFLFWVQSTAD